MSKQRNSPQKREQEEIKTKDLLKTEVSNTSE